MSLLAPISVIFKLRALTHQKVLLIYKPWPQPLPIHNLQ